MTQSEHPLKVTFICHSDTIGGASLVTYRLMLALRSEGVDARMIVFNKTTQSPYVTAVGNTNSRGRKFMMERGRIALANGLSRRDLFKVSIANTGFDLSGHPWITSADVIALSWINQGLLSLDDIRRLALLGKPIVWIMHDMWCMTGICHHAYECNHYLHECGRCQFLHSHRPGDLSHKVWLRKDDLYTHHPITFVAVSNWLADKARQSSLLGKRSLRVIHNAFPINAFSTKPLRKPIDPAFDGSKKIILMGAARLDDPIKGLKYAIDALNLIFDNRPELARSATAVFFGDIRNRELLEKLRFSHLYMGRINDAKILAQLYSLADVVLSTSLYETFPTTLIEGQAGGCLPVTFGRGGQSDIVTHLKDGYIAEYKNPRSIAEGIAWALSQNVDREALHQSVRDRFAASAIARRYIELFEELLK